MTTSGTWDYTNDAELIEAAWGLIANVRWENRSEEWQKAAMEWREGYHGWLDKRADETGDRGFPQEPVDNAASKGAD